MRVLCVGRHAYLSEHLCRYFGDLGAECDSAVGVSAVIAAARRYEPHVMVCDSELVTQAVLEEWSHEPLLAGIPLLAVSLTRRPEEAGPLPHSPTGVVYLPALERAQGVALLAGAYRPRGVQAPAEWRTASPVTQSTPR